MSYFITLQEPGSERNARRRRRKICPTWQGIKPGFLKFPDNARTTGDPETTLQARRFITVEVRIIASEDLAFQPVRLKQDVAGNALPFYF